jgi:hypothetical protein
MQWAATGTTSFNRGSGGLPGGVTRDDVSTTGIRAPSGAGIAGYTVYIAFEHENTSSQGALFILLNAGGTSAERSIGRVFNSTGEMHNGLLDPSAPTPNNSTASLLWASDLSDGTHNNLVRITLLPTRNIVRAEKLAGAALTDRITTLGSDYTTRKFTVANSATISQYMPGKGLEIICLGHGSNWGVADGPTQSEDLAIRTYLNNKWALGFTIANDTTLRT